MTQPNWDEVVRHLRTAVHNNPVATPAYLAIAIADAIESGLMVADMDAIKTDRPPPDTDRQTENALLRADNVYLGAEVSRLEVENGHLRAVRDQLQAKVKDLENIAGARQKTIDAMRREREDLLARVKEMVKLAEPYF